MPLYAFKGVLAYIRGVLETQKAYKGHIRGV